MDTGTDHQATHHSHERSERSEREVERTTRRLAREARRERRRRGRRGERTRGTRPAPELGAGAPAPPRSTIRRRLLRITTLGLAGVLVLLTAFPPFLIPTPGAVSSRFFIRNAPDSPRLFDFEHHTGLDIAAPIGTRVGASRSGRVVEVGTDPSYGLYVDVRHLFGWVTRYAHLSAVSVGQGRVVLRGRKIGEVGMTGRATGPHLHLEIRVLGRAYPPGVFLLFHRLRMVILGG